MLKKVPVEAIIEHDIFIEYKKKLKAKNDKEFWNALLEIEWEKLYYFIIAFPQEITILNTGEKDEEKHFLGYKFSDRKETQGIHPMQLGKDIDDCTQLYDSEQYENPKKASTYIYQAFKGVKTEIDESLKSNISRHRLTDLLTFDRIDFDKNISLTFKEKVEFQTKWKTEKLEKVLIKLESGKRPKGGVGEYRDGVPSLGGEHIGVDGNMNYRKIKFVPESYFNNATQGLLEDLDILICKDGALTGKVALFKKSLFQYDKGMINEHVFSLKTDNEVTQKYLFYLLYSSQGQLILKANVTGTAQGGLNRANLLNIKVPLPSPDVQEKLVNEIQSLEEKAKTVVIADIDSQKENIIKKYLQ